MKKTMKTVILATMILAVATTSLVLFAGCDEIEHGYLPNETIRFDIDYDSFELSMIPDEFKDVIPIVLNAFLDADQTYIEMTADGNFTLQLMIKADSLSGLAGPPFNLGELLQGVTKDSLDWVLDGYLSVMFPGFNLGNVEQSLSLVSKSAGLTFVGFDFENNSELAKLKAQIEDPTTNNIFPTDFDVTKIPSRIGAKISGPYKWLDFAGADVNKQYTFATVGYHDADTLPLLNFSIVEDDGIMTCTFRNEMLGLTIVGINAPDEE